MPEQLQANKAPDSDRVALKSQLVRRAMNELYVPPPAESTFRHGEQERLYDVAARTIGDCPITYLEFGVHRGWSMRRIAQRFPHPDARFIGFDSFEGLPEQWGPAPAGHFSTGGEAPKMNDTRIRFVKGWFQNTVVDHLAAHPVSGPTLVHFDADLYSSTLFLMTTLWHHVAEYYFLFDEFAPDEMVAMYDFTRAYPVKFAFFGATVNEHKHPLPLQVFGQLSKVPFEL